ncbi:MAG: methyltransferase domain-containing protein [Ignavibacteria bacterium]|nr:methyltransferase domain-containing protein [Ignavibacteria bacterium]
MKTFQDNFITALQLPFLFIKKFYFWHKTNKGSLPGKEFAKYGFSLAKKLVLKGNFSPKLLFNPVSIVRYFEFEYVHKNLSVKKNEKILDVSSPYLFGFYIANRHSVDYNYINPDKEDLTNVLSLSKRISFKAKYSAEKIDALNLPFEDNFFNKVHSISVIEHIKDDGDSAVLKEMWRVLKPEGLLVLTFPVKKEYEVEYKYKDEYNQDVERKSGKYFFQRIYDGQKIRERLLSSIDNFEIISKEIFGSTNRDFYNEYKQRWIKYSYWETVKDPYYITKYFTHYSDITDLADIGVMGLTIKK